MVAENVVLPPEVNDLPEEAFVKGWRMVTGEVPAIVLPDRRAMIAILVESCDVAEPPWTESGDVQALPSGPGVG